MARFGDFEGRSNRLEFWLYLVVFGVLLGAVRYAVLRSPTHIPVVELFVMLHIIPTITLAIRRLHDTGRTGWWLLLSLTTVGLIPLLVWFCLKSDTARDRFDRLDTSMRVEPDSATPVLNDSPSAVQFHSSQVRVVPQRSSDGFGFVVATCLGTSAVLVLMVYAVTQPVSTWLGWFGSSSPSCSSDSVKGLVSKIIKDDLAKDRLAATMDLNKTVVRIEAIRTVSSTERASECAAHVAADHVFKPPLDQVAQRLGQEIGLDVHYRAELTDDDRQVYVTVTSDQQ